MSQIAAYLCVRLILKEKVMKINESKDFGTALKLRRKELGYTQYNISDFLGLSVSFISDLERRRNSKRQSVMLICLDLIL